MKSEKKIFIFILISLVIGLSMINLISLIELKEQLVVHSKLLAKSYVSPKGDIRDNIPKFIKISEKYDINSNYEFVDKFSNYFISIKREYYSEKLKNHLLLLFMWEVILILSISILYFFTAYRMIQYRENFSKSFEVMLFVLGHKLKNFLSGQRINLEILGNQHSIDDNPIRRLKIANKNLEFELDNIRTFVANFKKMKSGSNVLDFCSEIKEQWKELNTENIEKNVTFNLQKAIRHRCNHQDIKYALYLILDNCVKYGQSKIIIRTFVFKKQKYIAFINDIDESIPRGLGVGLEIAEMLLRRNNISLNWKSHKRFILLMKVLKNSR